MSLLATVNWTNISGNWTEWILQGYTGILTDVWLYPVLFMGIIGYVYAITQSATSAAVTIALVFGIFGVTGVFAGPSEFGFLSWAIVITAFSAAFTALFVGRKR